MPRHDPLPRAIATGPFSVREGFDAGATKKRLRGADLARPFHGIRTLKQATAPDAARAHDYDNDALDLIIRRCSEYAPLLREGQHFSHLTAAVLWRIPLPGHVAESDPLHVTSTTPRNAPRGAGIVGHRAPPVAIHTRFGFPVSSPENTWLALASVGTPVDELIVAGDALVLDPAQLDPRDIRPYTTIDRLATALAHYVGRGKRAAVEAIRQVRQGAESRQETRLRLLVVRAGFPEPVLQAQILDAAGRPIGRGDLYYPEFRTILEYDGQHHRTNDRQYESDLARVERFTRSDYEYVRVTKSRMQSPRVVISLLDNALRVRGWTG